MDWFQWLSVPMILVIRPSVRSCSQYLLLRRGESWPGPGPVPCVRFLPVVPPGHDKISWNCNKSVTTHSYAASGASSIRGRTPDQWSHLTTLGGGKLREENFVHCNKTMWSVMRLGSQIGQFVSMFIGYIQLCLWFMKLRIVFPRVAGTGNKMAAFYIRSLDSWKMGMFQLTIRI